MPPSRLRPSAAICSTVCGLVLGAGAPAPAYDAAACFLAGIQPADSEPPSWSESEAWKTHQQLMGKRWEAYEDNTLKKIEAWAEKQVTPHTKQGGVVRYIFSGPDILHALRMFPDAGTFILCGLEPIGEAPTPESLTAPNAAAGLREIRSALGEILQFSFFRTNDMKDDLRQEIFPGTIPVMLLFLAASGQEVLDLEYLELKPDGTVRPLKQAGPEVDGVRIDFSARAKPAARRSLFYFSTNVADFEIGKTGFLKFLESQPEGAAYAKAASYLMHKEYFSLIRGHLLSRSEVIIQDDSGIPYNFFDEDDWEISLFGTYDGPIKLFSEWRQDSLRKAYRTGSQPLDFGTGYKWREGQSNLMRMVRRGGVVRQ